MRQIYVNRIREHVLQQLVRNQEIYHCFLVSPQLNHGSDSDFRKKVFQPRNTRKNEAALSSTTFVPLVFFVVPKHEAVR